MEDDGELDQEDDDPEVAALDSEDLDISDECAEAILEVDQDREADDEKVIELAGEESLATAGEHGIFLSEEDRRVAAKTLQLVCLIFIIILRFDSLIFQFI